MTTKRHFVMLAFMVLALGVSFTAGSVGTSASCDPANCDPSDCEKACESMSAAECAKICPPECIVICDEPCAGAQQVSDGCNPGSSISACSIGTKASGNLAGLDPAGSLSFKLAAGQGAEINK